MGRPQTEATREKLRQARLGTKHSEETKKKISANSARLKPWEGKTFSSEHKSRLSRAHKGRPKSEEWKRKISEARKGKKRPPFSDEWKARIAASVKATGRHPPNPRGRVHSKETKTKIAQAHLLKEFPRITPVHRLIRTSAPYKDWRKAVFERDNYTCQICGVRSCAAHPVVLNADHVKRFSEFPDLRFELSNGRSLCVPCHKQTDTYGSRRRVA